jgi:cation:H+ antiporter
MPALLAVTLLTVMLFMDGYLGRIDGVLLVCGMVLVLRWLVKLGIRSKGADPLQQEIAAELPASMTMTTAVGWLLLGLVVLLAGAKLLVWGATHLAEALGVSNFIIGLTVVAVGTSLPELAVSVVSALKQEHDIALGTIIGSNMFNCLAVIGPAAIISPEAFDSELLSLHFPVMIALTLGMFALTYNFTGSGRISRIEGAILLAVFVGYESYVVHIQ